MRTPIATPTITYEWDVDSVPVLEQKGRYDRAVVRIQPRRIQVTRSQYDSGHLRVYIEGRSVRKDGEFGAHNRACGYGGKPVLEPDPADDIDQLPAWARPYYDEAMRREGLS